MDTGDGSFVSEDSSEGIALKDYKETFLTDTIILVIESQNIYSPDTIEYLSLLGEDIRDEMYVSDVLTPADIITSKNGGLVPETESMVKKIADGLPEDTKEKFFSSQLITIGAVYLNAGLSDETKFTFINNLESLIANSDMPPGVKISLSGDTVFFKQMQEEMKSTMRTLIITAIAFMIIALFFLFSYVQYRFLPIAVIAGSLIATVGILVMLKIPVSTPVVGAFPVIIGLGIDYAIQFHSRFNEEVGEKSIPDAIVNTITKSGPVILIAMCTTAMGFVALLFTPIPMIGQFGAACIIGVICSYIIAIIAVPAFFAIRGYESRTKTKSVFGKNSAEKEGPGAIEKYDIFLGRLSGFIARRPVLIILVFGFIGVLGISLDEKVGVNVDTYTFVPEEMPARVNMEKVEGLIENPTTLPVKISADSILDPDVLLWMDEFAIHVSESNKEVLGYTGISTLIKNINGGNLPDSVNEAKALMSMIPDDKASRYLFGNTASVIEFNTESLEMEEVALLLERINKDIAWSAPPPGVEAFSTGMQRKNGDFYSNMIFSKGIMTPLGVILIALFLILVYRRAESVAPLIPVLMIIGWNTLAMYALNISYSPLTACLGSMTIGIAMEYTILIMERCEEELETGCDLYTAIERGVSKIGSAITISGVTTFLGFSALIFSNFSVISLFGQTTVIAIIFSLAGGIVVMPAVIALVYRSRIKESASTVQAHQKDIENPDLSCAA